MHLTRKDDLLNELIIIYLKALIKINLNLDYTLEIPQEPHSIYSLYERNDFVDNHDWNIKD